MMSEEKPCKIFKGYKDKGGYGIVTTLDQSGSGRLAHRAVWIKANGPIPQGMVIRHICNNRACIELTHLRLGTQADNVRDKVKLGSQAKGEKIGLAVLTEDDVRTIKRMKKKGYLGTYVADKFEVHPSTVYAIWNKRTWRHVK